MFLTNVFTIIAILAVIWYTITTLQIYDFLQKHSIKVNFLLLRFFAPSYANQYKRITQQQNGKTGELFYHWIISINIALLAVILIIISNIWK